MYYPFMCWFLCRPLEPLGVKLLSPKQYSMCYRVPKRSEDESARNRLGLFSASMYAVVGGQDGNIPQTERMLPLAFEATDGTLRILLQKPVVVDSTKFPESNYHNNQYAELLMLTSWFDENDELGSACRSKYFCSVMHSHLADQINSVKEGCRSLLLGNL